MDYKIKIVTLCFIFLHGSITINCLECPDCMHIGYKFTNMPSYLEDLMVSLMDSFKMTNLACKANTTRPTGCYTGGFGSVSKCVSTVVTVNAQGMKTLYPEAGMEMEVVNRGCTSRPRSEADSCNHISSVWDAGTQAKLMQSLQRLTQRFNAVSYNGQVCYNSQRSGGSGGSYQNPTTKSWYNAGGRSTTRMNQWQRTTKDSSTSSANIVNVYKVAYFVWTLFLLKAFC